MAAQLVTPAADTACDALFALLAAGVPLSLLMDLAAAPSSEQLYAEERSDVAWVPAPRRVGQDARLDP